MRKKNYVNRISWCWRCAESRSHRVYNGNGRTTTLVCRHCGFMLSGDINQPAIGTRAS